MHKLLLLVAAVSAAPLPDGDQAPVYVKPAAPYGPPPQYGQAPGPYDPAPAPYKPAPAPFKPVPAKYKPSPVKYKPVYEEEEDYAPQPYKYEYGVQDDYTNAAFAKSESQNEVGTVTGRLCSSALQV